MKKLSYLMFLVGIVFLFAPMAQTSAKENEKINFENLEFNIEEMEIGESIKLEDGELIKFSNEEAAKILSDNSDKSYEEALALFETDTSTSTLSSTRSCAQGATAFVRSLEVTNSAGGLTSYKPQLYVFLEFCENSAGQYVVKSIVDSTINRQAGGLSKGFSGTIKAEALNSGKTLYWRVEGKWVDNFATTITFTTGLGTAKASVGFQATIDTSFFGNTFQAENHIFFN